MRNPEAEREESFAQTKTLPALLRRPEAVWALRQAGILGDSGQLAGGQRPGWIASSRGWLTETPPKDRAGHAGSASKPSSTDQAHHLQRIPP
jgi:hypothetical protein